MWAARVEPDEDFYGVGGDLDSFSDGDNFKAADCDKSNPDDEELLMFIKKFACNALRQLICPGPGPSITTRARGDGREATVQRNVSMPDISYYSEVLDSLGPDKRGVIESYGFGGPMLFDRCAIPLPFARWVADHVEVRSSEIVVKNKSIPLSPQIVADVLGIPIGGRKFSKKDSELGKIDFLSAIRSTTLPDVKSFGDNLLRDDLSNDETVRSFLVVALVTFLCPCSSLTPSKEYLAALVDPSTANEWDWASLVHYWYLKHIRKYNALKNKVVDSSIPLGGCLYVLCVVYLDSLVLVHEQLPFTLPRVCVWKGDMIKGNANLDCVEGDTYGKLPILPQKDTWYGKRISRSFKKAVVESVDGYLNVETLDAITTLYTKHTSTSSSLPPHLVQNIIIDVVSLLHQRATTNIISQSDQLGVDGPRNVSIRPDVHHTWQ